MSHSSRFTVAVHVLGMLALGGSVPKTSETIARSVNTNPVVIRRILGILGKAGLVETHPGAGGGSILAHPPQKISLLEGYRLMENRELFPLHNQPPSDDCLCGRHIQVVLLEVFSRASRAMEEVLAETTVADIAHQIEELEEGACQPC